MANWHLFIPLMDQLDGLARLTWGQTRAFSVVLLPPQTSHPQFNMILKLHYSETFCLRREISELIDCSLCLRFNPNIQVYMKTEIAWYYNIGLLILRECSKLWTDIDHDLSLI